MADKFTRFRRRLTPGKKAGSQKLGYFNSMITSGGAPTGNWHPAEVFPQFFNYQAPYVNAEFIADQDDHQGPPYYVGGPLKVLKVKYTNPYDGVHGKGTYVRSDGLQRYVGGFAPPVNSWFGGTDVSTPAQFLIPNSPFFPNVSTYGAKAWQMAKPRIEKSNVFVSLREAKDIPRMLKTTSKAFSQIWKTMGGNLDSRVMAPKNIGDQFLNQQFGWVPFLKDLRSFNNTFQNTSKYLNQLTERNGKWSRRKVTVSKTDDMTKLNSGSGQILDPILGTHWSQYFSVQPHWELTEEVISSVTAVGSFTYYRPEFDANLSEYNSGWNRVMRQLDLYGLRASPSNIYKSTPWTWAADWVTDASSYIDYYNDILVDSVVCKYFYLMQHQTVIRKLVQVLPFYSGSVTLTFTREIETKQRVEGSSPFDFSLSWKDLTPRQLAIAAALWLTRRS